MSLGPVVLLMLCKVSCSSVLVLVEPMVLLCGGHRMGLVAPDYFCNNWSDTERALDLDP